MLCLKVLAFVAKITSVILIILARKKRKKRKKNYCLFPETDFSAVHDEELYIYLHE